MSNSYTSSFAATENPIAESSRWVNGLATGLDWTNVRTTPGKAFGTQTGTVNFDDSIAILGGLSSWDAIQVVRATVFATNPISSADFTAHPDLAQEVELLLRFSLAGHSATGYEITYSVNPQNPYVQINRWNGTLGGFTLLATAVAPPIIGAGDQLKATICGKHICCYVNDVLVLAFDDTTYASGKPGIGFYWHSTSGVGTYAPSDFGFSSMSASNYDWAEAGCNLVGVAANPGAASFATAALSNAPPAGTRVFALFAVSLAGSGVKPSVTSVTDNTGATWYCDHRKANNVSTTYGEELSVWTSIATGAAITAITPHWSVSLAASAGLGYVVAVFGGMAAGVGAAVILDIAQTSVDTTSPMSSGTSPGTTDRFGELKLSVYSDAGNNSTIGISTPDSNFAILNKQDASSVTQVGMAYTAAGPAGSSAQTAWTSTVNADCLVGVLVYRAIDPNTGVRESHTAFPKPRLRA